MSEQDIEDLGNDLIAIVACFLDAGREALAGIHQVHAAFGAPGDYGYNTKKGKALNRLYNSSRPLAELANRSKGEEKARTNADQTGGPE